MLTHLRQIAIQASSLLIYLALAWPYFSFREESLPWPESAFAIGAIALAIASWAGQPWWWRLIHAIFVPLLWQTSQFGIEPGWFLLAFIALFLVFRGAVGGRIPLYLSNVHTVAALAELITERDAKQVVDLGAGLGSVVAPLAAEMPERRFIGIENAPASWLFGFLRTRGLANCAWHNQSLWDTPLGEADLVYAFLSPEPMPRLWQKAVREMRPGSMLVSNTFPVPEITPTLCIELGDRRGTVLYCYAR